MSLGDFLNGAGPFVALSALPMVAGLLARQEALALRLRRLAIFLALALPLVFLALALTLYVPRASRAPFDFEVNYNAALALYGQGANPYSVHAAYSFPFPSFYLYWLGSAFGEFDEARAWVVWWSINAVIWLLSALTLSRMLPVKSRQPRQRDTLSYAAVAIPATTVLWQGQTALFVLAGVVALHAALSLSAHQNLNVLSRYPRTALARLRAVISSLGHRARWIELSGGVGLALATLIKPQMALVGLGIALWGWLAFRAGRSGEAATVLRIIVSALIVSMALIGLTLLLPGGVTLDTYRHFVTDALPQVAKPADSIQVIGSPAFVAAVIALRSGTSEATADLVATAVTLIVLAAATWWTVRRANRPLTEIAAGWGVWAMVAPRVSWTWYAVWLLPFFALAALESSSRRLALIALTLGLLNLQFNVSFLELGAILLLIGLVWTGFRD